MHRLRALCNGLPGCCHDVVEAKRTTGHACDVSGLGNEVLKEKDKLERFLKITKK
jgi:hypothetical protein